MILYYFIFFVILFGCYISIYTPELNGLMFGFFSVTLIFLAGFRGVGVSRDMSNYLYVFDNVFQYSDIGNFGMEPMATLIPVILKSVGIYGITSIFLIFSIISLSPKMISIYKLSPLPLFSCLLFYSYIFFRQDFTQIRAGVAFGIFFWAIQDIFDRNWSRFYLKVFIACLFHYSALIYLPLYLLKSNRINKKIYTVIILLVFSLAIMHINIFSVIPGFSSVNSRLQTYVILSQAGAVASDNILSYGNLINLALLLVLLYFSDCIYNNNKYGILFIKLYYIGLLLYALIGPLSVVIAGRIYELFVGLLCVSLLYLRYFIRPTFIANTLIIAYSLFFFRAVMNSGTIMPYSLSF